MTLPPQSRKDDDCGGILNITPTESMTHGTTRQAFSLITNPIVTIVLFCARRVRLLTVAYTEKQPTLRNHEQAPPSRP